MTSKNFFTKLTWRNLVSRNVWTLLSFLAFFLSIPVMLMLRLDSLPELVEPARLYQQMNQELAETIGYGNELMIVLVIGMPYLLAMSGYWYLYSGEKTDFYHSLPVRRETLFFSNYLAGILIFAVPYGLNLLFAMGIGIAKGAGFTGMWTVLAGSFAANIVVFLLFYNLAVLGILLTGNLFTGTLAYGTFLIYGILIFEALHHLGSRFFDTFVSGGGYNVRGEYYSSSFCAISNKTSPVLRYFNLLSDAKPNYTSMGSFPAGEVAVFGVSALVILVLCVFAYKKRPTESYHKAIAFRKLEPVIKIGMVVPLSLLIGLFLSAYASRTFVWFVAATFLSALILLAAVEFLYHMDLKECFRPRISSGIVLGTLALTILAARLDVFGVDTWLLKENKLESMSVYINGLNSLYSYPYEEKMEHYMAYLDKVELKEYSAVYELAKAGVEEQKNNSIKASGEAHTDTISFYVKYNRKNGRSVYKYYTVEKTQEMTDLIGAIYDNWEFKEKTLPVEYIKGENLRDITITDIYNTGRKLQVTKTDMNNILKTYKHEWENLKYQNLKEQKVQGYLNFQIKYEPDWFRYAVYEETEGIQVPIYDSFTGTLELLKQTGAHIYTKEDAAEIEKIIIDEYPDDMHEPKTTEYTDEKEIREIMEKVEYDNNNGFWTGKVPDYNKSIQIHWKDGIGESYSVVYFIKGDYPACVK
ncbi:MAG: DUF6449 domain-containing protein [Blautia sp.]